FEPTVMGTGGVGGGGVWATPPLIAPVQATVHPRGAAGRYSIMAGPCVQGPAAGGPMTPHGTSKSCVIGSPLRAAGNPSDGMAITLNQTRRWRARLPARGRAP